MPSAASKQRLHVVIAGGGIAATELILALRSLAGSAVRLTMIAPTDRLHYRAIAVEPFAARAARRYPLDEICADLDVALLHDTLARVEPSSHTLVTGAGAHVGYDVLVVATGARSGAGIEHAHTCYADADPESLAWIVREIELGVARRVAFVVPPGHTWSLPIYELALTTAARARAAGAAPELTVVTPEDAPLAIFQGAGSAVVAELLDELGVAVIVNAYAHGYDGSTLALAPGDRTLDAERVVALPVLRGPGIEGLPCDAEGFVHVDDHGRVPGVDGTFAVGDATTFALKQGGIAAQQADVAAGLIARLAGATVPEPDARPRLRAVLFTGDGPLYLRATITGGESVVSTASRHCPWWPPQRVAARHLAPYLADRDEVDPQLATRHALAARLTGAEAIVHPGNGMEGIELLGRDR